jgi:hypothetical protein
MADEPVLPDGRYDALVVDAARVGESLRVELAIIAGDHKGEVVSVTALGIERDELDLLGVPATVTVAGGHPTVDFEG